MALTTGEDHCRLKCRVQVLALPLHEFMTWSTRYEECSPSRDCTELSDLLNESSTCGLFLLCEFEFPLRVCAQSITFACSPMFRIYAGKWFKLSVSQNRIILEEFILSIASHTLFRRMNEMTVAKTTERVRHEQPNQSRYDFLFLISLRMTSKKKNRRIYCDNDRKLISLQFWHMATATTIVSVLCVHSKCPLCHSFCTYSKRIQFFPAFQINRTKQ